MTKEQLEQTLTYYDFNKTLSLIIRSEVQIWCKRKIISCEIWKNYINFTTDNITIDIDISKIFAIVPIINEVEIIGLEIALKGSE